MPKRTSYSSHNRKHMRSVHLLENLTYLGDNHIPTTIEQIQYNKQSFNAKTIPLTDDLKKNINKDYVNWFKITGISDVSTIYNICKSFGIQRFDVKDLISNTLVTKVITYDKSTFILMSCSTINQKNELEVSQIAFILTQSCVISIQEQKTPIFDVVIEAIKSSRIQITEKGCDYLLYILLNCVSSFYSDSILKITNQVNQLEDFLIDQDTDNLDIMKFIQNRKKDYFLLKRIISPMREEYPNLLHNTNNMISGDDIIFFNDFDDRLRIASENIEALHESITSLTDLYFNKNNMKMNQVIKKLTVVSTIFIPLTFMAGIWGMNFEGMPELKWKFGYLYAWGIMLMVVALAIYFLKKKRWF